MTIDRDSQPCQSAPASSAHESARAQFSRTAAQYAASVPHATSDSLGVVRRWVSGSRYDTALDIATGPGFTAFAVAPYCQAVVASDISQAMLERVVYGASERHLTNITTAIADATSLPFPDESIDLATCRTAPHHFQDIVAFISETYRILRPGGIFVLVDTTTFADPELRDWHHRVELARDPSHVRALTPEEWESALGAGGFEVVETASTRVEMTFRDWVARSKTPGDVVSELERDFNGASDGVRDAFRLSAISDGTDWAWSWPVFAGKARKPR